MTHRHLLNTATIAVLSALLACGEAGDPVEPGAAGDQPRLAPEFAWASNSWATRAPMPSGREHLAVWVANNSAGQAILYALGGWAAGTFSDVAYKIEAYNYATNTWTTKIATLSLTQTNGVGVIGGKLYISGGGAHTGEGFERFKILYVYDPVADVLLRKADMPRPTADGITGVIGGKLYVLTGTCGDCAEFISRRFYRYDPTTNTWAFLTWAPRAHVAGVGGVINGKFYVAGGFNGSMSTTNLDAYDPATNRWTARAPLPKAVTQAGGAVLNNKLYVIGGAVGPLGEAVRTVYAYDPVTNTWQTKASMPTARHGLAAATITAFANSKILAIGGDHGFADPKPHTANEAYKP
jgi:N-acetylneuraminic acid mutarotase